MPSSQGGVIREAAQAAIAVVLVAGAIVIAVILVSRGTSAGDIPTWLAASVGVALGHYFNHASTSSMVDTLTNGPLHMLADLAQRGPRRSTDPTQPPPTESNA